MARLTGLIRKMSGSAGDFTFKRVSGGTVVSEKVTEVKNARTSAQQRHRMKWANVIQMYKGLKPLIKYGFENKPQNVTDYNMFVKINMQLDPAYLSKAQVAGGACIAAPYQISQGSLPSIEVSGTDGNRVTNIKLGGLNISESTTVAEFSNAVVQNNEKYSYGDQISYFAIHQKVNGTTGIPYCEFEASYVILKKFSQTPIWNEVHKDGFRNVNGFIGHNPSDGDVVFCWVHSRDVGGKTLISSQQLLLNNPLFSEYTSQDAYSAAVATYGGENEVFLSHSNVDAESSGSGRFVNESGNADSGNGSSANGGTTGNEDDDDDDKLPDNGAYDGGGGFIGE